MIEQQKKIIEGLLMAADRPLSVECLAKIFESSDFSSENNQIKAILDLIVEDCAGRGVELKEVASGYRFQIKSELSTWIGKLFEERPPRYSRAMLEVLALIAYRQPITRGEIEEIRGVVVSSNIVKTLLEHEWIRVAGYKNVPGKPAILVTTKKFLDYFNLKSLQDLPPLIEFTEVLQNEANNEVVHIEQQVESNEMTHSEPEFADSQAETFSEQ